MEQLKKFKEITVNQSYTVMQGEIWADDLFIKGGRKLYQCHSFEFDGRIIDKAGRLHNPSMCKKVRLLNNQ